MTGGTSPRSKEGERKSGDKIFLSHRTSAWLFLIGHSSANLCEGDAKIENRVDFSSARPSSVRNMLALGIVYRWESVLAPGFLKE